MTDPFAFAWEFIQRFETSAVVDDPDDPGGLTKYGITQRYFPTTDIAHLTEDEAKEIFRTYYWLRTHCDRLPYWLAVAVADGAFNQGASTTVYNLQRALNTLPDGKMGPKTMEAIADASPVELLENFLAWRGFHYAAGSVKYRRGWFRRLFSLQREVLMLMQMG